ncbi:MAG: FeoB-associated Cys-rich membrane protein [Lachnospiraceae bacterium]|nr:FeoB-associated Cys-rich membrane protein [Lachnospiraceae bacterium]
MNFSTFLILLIILLLVGFAVRTIYKNKKEGKCCSGCSGCSGNCHKSCGQE